MKSHLKLSITNNSLLCKVKRLFEEEKQILSNLKRIYEKLINKMKSIYSCKKESGRIGGEDIRFERVVTAQII